MRCNLSQHITSSRMTLFSHLVSLLFVVSMMLSMRKHETTHRKTLEKITMHKNMKYGSIFHPRLASMPFFMRKILFLVASFLNFELSVNKQSWHSM